MRIIYDDGYEEYYEEPVPPWLDCIMEAALFDEPLDFQAEPVPRMVTEYFKKINLQH